MSEGESHKKQPSRRRQGPEGMSAPAEKPKEFKATWARLIKYGKSHLPMLIVVFAVTIVGSAFQVYAPRLVGDLTDHIWTIVTIGSIDMPAIGKIGLTLILIYAIVAAMSVIQGWFTATITQKITKQMRTDISRKINRLPFKFFGKVSYGDVLSHMTNDADTVGQTMNQSITMLISSLSLLIGSIIMMFYVNWIMAATAIATSLGGFAMMFIIIKRSQKYFTEQQENLGECNGLVEEAYSGHTVIKAYNNSATFKEKFTGINVRLYDSAWKSQFFSGLMFPLMGFIGNFAYVAICIVGAVLMMNGTIGFGVITAFMIYVRLFTQPLSQLAQAATNLQRVAAASEHIFEFLDVGEMEDEGQKTKRLTNVRGDVEFRNVKFGYVPGKTVIHDFSANVKAGQRIAIVGPTGAGKTTLVNLLMRFYELDGGEIRIDGTPITEVPRENVHEQFCMVLQDTWLFEGTIKENIVYSQQNIPDATVEEACKTVGLHHFIQTLPEGYNTVLNETASLSEGQKQLLTIARAIIKDSPLLILDEATSSVDTRTERIVQSAMDKLTVGRTAFIIAHRLSTIKNADRILVIRDGDIVESGNHDELLSQKGFYADLYNSQFEGAT
jgi:ATP-binding cassette subfamily B protein